MDFSELAAYFDKIEKVSSRLEMTAILAEMLQKVPQKDMKNVIFLSQGTLGPRHAGLEAGLGEGLLEQGIAKATGYTKEEITAKYKEIGDLGSVAEQLCGKKKQGSLFAARLTVEKVFSNFLRIAATEGRGSQDSKLGMFAELLNSASGVEARFITRIPLGNMRLGVGDPTIMDALALNYIDEFLGWKGIRKEIEAGLKEKNDEKRKEEFERRARQRLRGLIESKYNIFSDLGEIAARLKAKGLNGLDEIEIAPGTPIRPTLAERLPSAEEIAAKLGRCAVEAKYDGLRVQCHKDGNDVTIFSRQSENITEMFPDLVDAVRKQITAKKAIFEGEALACNEGTGQYFPFQVTMTRKRKYGIAEKAEELPLKLFAFDVMYIDGKNMMPKPFSERREKLGKIISKGGTIELTKSIVTDSPKKMDAFFMESIESGLEGIIAKDLNAPYIAGARKFAWIKLKRSYRGELNDSVDLTIIGYYKGRGKRTQFGLGGLLTAAYDEASDTFKSVTKIGTGMTEEVLTELEAKLSRNVRKQKPARVDSELEPDAWVEPKTVIEVVADEITRSPLHTCGKGKDGVGYALRFPRMVKFREKKPEESTTTAEIMSMYGKQANIHVQGADQDRAIK